MTDSFVDFIILKVIIYVQEIHASQKLPVVICVQVAHMYTNLFFNSEQLDYTFINTGYLSSLV